MLKVVQEVEAGRSEESGFSLGVAVADDAAAGLDCGAAELGHPRSSGVVVDFSYSAAVGQETAADRRWASGTVNGLTRNMFAQLLLSQASDGRFVRPTLRGALLGKEIGGQPRPTTCSG